MYELLSLILYSFSLWQGSANEMQVTNGLTEQGIAHRQHLVLTAENNAKKLFVSTSNKHYQQSLFRL